MQITPSLFTSFGLAGSILTVLAIGITWALYRDKEGRRYSAFNRYISELGEVGVSPAAVVFNGGLIVAGVLYIPFLVWLGLRLGGVVGTLAILGGMWAAVSCILVGIFPMNHEEAHLKAATSYFRGGLATMLFYSLGILLQPAGGGVVPRYSAIYGAAGVVFYSWFLLLLARREREKKAQEALAAAQGLPEDPGPSVDAPPAEEEERPRFLPIAMVEWGAFLVTMGWFFFVALAAR